MWPTLGPWDRETAFLLTKVSSVTLHLSLRFLIRKWGFIVATQQGGHGYYVAVIRGDIINGSIYGRGGQTF